MSAPQSLPVVQPQPNLPNYGFSYLQLFQTYTRAAFLSAFGAAAPNWNPSLPPKYWFDTSGETPVYDVIDQDGNMASIGNITLTGAQAASVNIPGVTPYPAYMVASTPATVNGVGVNPNYLSLESDAQNMQNILAAALGVSPASIPVEDGSPTGIFQYTPNGDARRMWNVMVGGEGLNVGLLMLNMNSEGIGAPGQWTGAVSNPASILWVAAPLPADGITTGVSNSPPVPVPVRALLPNEEFTSTLMSAQITRTDLNTATTVGEGGFTAAQQSQILTTLAWIESALESLGVGS
jgi:hypothetical protein